MSFRFVSLHLFDIRTHTVGLTYCKRFSFLRYKLYWPFCSLDVPVNGVKDENQNMAAVADRRAASPYTNDNSKWVEVTGAVTRDAVNKVDGLSVLPVEDTETNEELALQIAMDPTIETSKEFDERRALQKAKLLSRLRNESDVDIAGEIPGSANDSPARLEGMRENDDRQDDVFIVELEKGDDGIGLGLIDGLVSDVMSLSETSC